MGRAPLFLPPDPAGDQTFAIVAADDKASRFTPGMIPDAMRSLHQVGRNTPVVGMHHLDQIEVVATSILFKSSPGRSARAKAGWRLNTIVRVS